MEMKQKQCSATIVFGDDYGDNRSTFHCQLEKGHVGPHQEKGDMGDEFRNYPMPYTLTWDGTESEKEALFQTDLLEMQRKCPHNDIKQYKGFKFCHGCGKESV